MATFDLGRVTPLYKGDYNASTSYELNDVVLYNGNLYWHVQATATVGILPTDTTVWKLAFSDEGVRAEIREYADDAQASKTAAAQSASQASASASNASASASQAASSAQAAGTSEGNASASASAAATSATNSAVSAQSAASSAQTATDKAALATNKAQAASESASLATAKANAAATSETNAVTAAQTATTKASEAAASATSAQEYDESAQASAVNAQTAQGLAETAQTGAETAQGLAEDARDEAQSIVDEIGAKASQIDALDTRVTAVEGDIDDINDRLTNDYIPVDGENLVTPQNIQGVGFTKTSQEIAGENIFSSDLLFEEDYYINIDASVNPPVITHGVYSGYKTYCVPVDGVPKYTFTSARFACLAKGNTLASEAVGTLQPYATEITTTGASYLFLSYEPSTDFANIEIHKITEQDTYTDFEMPEWSGIPALQNRVYELQYLNGVNLFDHAELIKENGYATISNGKIAFANSSGYNAYLIPVDGKSIYTFTSCRFAFLVDSDKESAIGSLLQNVVKVDSTGASYIAFSFDTSTYPVADYSVVGDVRINTNKQPFAYVSGNLASGGNLQVTAPRTNLRKGERIVFEGDITSFSSLKIGLSSSTAVDTESNQINTFLIDETNISYYVQSTNTPVVVAHGLTIANNIQIIWEMTAVASVKFTLISNGNMFEHEFTGFARKTIGKPYVLSINTVMTDCKLSWTCTDINKKIWMFGDSYFAYSTDRWTYYLHEYGYDNNCLLDGFPGEGSTNGRVAFNNLLRFGTPKFAVWCLGMNDGGDSESAPSSAWESEKNIFLNYCASNNIVPIFATIPTVPSINHEQKNAWIRSSGYRYIDFAKAVGATSSGVWYGDMLANDNVHPLASGARALFARVLLDLPEIMVDDF